MSAKQDRAAARTPEDLERKYKFEQSFANIMGVATDARTSAEQAKQAAEEAKGSVANMTQDKLFDILTNHGASEGVYRDENGNVYVNASYIRSGTLKSQDGDVYFDLENGIIRADWPQANGDIYTTSLHCQGITIAVKDAIDGTSQQLFRLAFNSGGTGVFGVLLTDNMKGGEHSRGISVRGVGGTDIGHPGSVTYLNGSKIFITKPDGSMVNLLDVL